MGRKKKKKTINENVFSRLKLANKHYLKGENDGFKFAI